jgi:hypothetical protein
VTAKRRPRKSSKLNVQIEEESKNHQLILTNLLVFGSKQEAENK